MDIDPKHSINYAHYGQFPEVFVELPVIKPYNNQPVSYAQKKMNGFFCEVYKDKGGIIRAFLKNRKENIWPLLTKIIKISDSIYRLPPCSVIFGELHFPHLPSASVITWLKSSNQSLKFSTFAMPVLDEMPMGNVDCIQISSAMRSYGFDVPDIQRIADNRPLSYAEQNKFLTLSVEEGIEGYVLKLSHLSGWYKLKPIQTVDAFVLTHEVSYSANYYGGLKSFVVAVKDINDSNKIIANVPASSFEDSFRRKKSCEYKKYYGRVMEVAYQDVLSNGKLQFPRFLRWRDDKDASQCTIDQL